jgi:hypothetical protein
MGCITLEHFAIEAIVAVSLQGERTTSLCFHINLNLGQIQPACAVMLHNPYVSACGFACLVEGPFGACCGALEALRRRDSGRIADPNLVATQSFITARLPVPNVHLADCF